MSEREPRANRDIQRANQRPTVRLGAMIGLPHSELPLRIQEKIAAIRSGLQPRDIASTKPGLIATVRPEFGEYLERWYSFRQKPGAAPIDVEANPRVLGEPDADGNQRVRMDQGGFMEYSQSDGVVFFPKGTFVQTTENGPKKFVADYGVGNPGVISVPAELVVEIIGHDGDFCDKPFPDTSSNRTSLSFTKIFA